VRAPLLACACLLTACPKPPAPPPGPADAGQHRRASTDLRSALLLVFPEYRGAHIQSGEATLERRYAAPVQPLAGWTTLADGGWAQPPWLVTRRDATTWQVVLPLNDEVAGRLFASPAPASTAEFAAVLPRSEVELETWRLELRYVAVTPPRAAFLAHQLVELLRNNGQWVSSALPPVWGKTADGGTDVPESFDVTLTEVVGADRSPTVVTVHRDGARVQVAEALVTDERLP
jgi:hypothetical protein